MESLFARELEKPCAKAENVAFNSYSSPLQRHTRSNVEFS